MLAVLIQSLSVASSRLQSQHEKREREARSNSCHVCDVGYLVDVMSVVKARIYSASVSVVK